MLSVQTNVTSLIAQENLRVDTNFQSRTIQRLTSGYRINSSGDDPAGLAVANSYRNSEAELTQGIQNANDGISTLQIIDGGMNNVGHILDRLKTLATQSASDTFTGDRNVLNSEFQGLVSEINRQAQSIGLDQNGAFARSLSVYIGGGRAHTTDAATNSSLQFNLSSATVDAKSLGLTGMQALGGTAGVTDIGNGSKKTTVAMILAQNTTPVADETDFYLSGPGFSGASKVKVAVNTSSVSDTNSLVTAINDAIANAGNEATPAAKAFQAANISASVSTDTGGKQQLAFSSSTSAFQVEAGDMVANALMGNFANASTSALAANMGSTFTGSLAQVDGTTLANPTNVSFQIQGGGLASPVTISLKNTSTTVGAAITDLQTQINANSDLAGQGITVTQASSGAALVFHSARGEQLQVNVTGDTANALGMGSFVAGAGGAVDYTSLGGAAFSTSQNYGSATLEFSINGQASDSNSVVVDMTAGPHATAATVTSGDSATGTVAINPNNNTLNLVVNGTAVSVTLSTSAAATKNDIADQIDAVTSSHGVNATVVGNAITLTDATKGAGGTIQVLNGNANATLGFTTQLRRGASATVDDVADQINQQVAANTTLAAAGIQATNSAGSLAITSSNNTNFRVNAFNTAGLATSAASVTGATGSDTPDLAAVNVGSTATTFAIQTNTNDQLNFKIDGGATQTVTLTAGSTTGNQIRDQINAVFTANSIAATASYAGGKLTIASTSTGLTSSVQVLAGSANALVGLSTGVVSGVAASGAVQSGGTGTFTINAAENDKLTINVTGANGNANQVFTLASGSRTIDQVVTALSGLVGATASKDGSGHLKITTTTGTAVTIVGGGVGDASATFGLTAGTTYAVAATGAYKTGGAGTFSIDPAENDKLRINVTGANGNATQVFTLGAGSKTIDQIVTALSGLQGATASKDVGTGHLVITTTTGTAVTIVGGAGDASATVGLTAGSSAYAVAATGGYQTGGSSPFTTVSGTNDVISIKIDNVNGGNQQDITLGSRTGYSVQNMASLINQTLIGGTASVVGGALTITSSATGTSSGVTIVSGGANDASTALGFGSVDVDAHGVDGSAGVATGTAAGPVTITDNTSNNTLQVAVAGVQGGATQTITLTSGAGQNATAIAGQINAQLVGATAAVVGGNLRITSTATGSTSDVTIGATNALGFATGAAGNGSDGSSASSAGTVAGPVTITDLAGTNNTLTVGVAGVNGGAGQKIVLTTGATQTAATIAGQINAQLVGATASVDGVTNKLTITSTATGTTSGVTITVGAGGSGDASQVLGFGASTNTANGVDATAASDQGSSITPPVTFLAANSNTLLVTIDGGSQQTITLAQGPQSNDQIVAAINNQLTAGTGTAFVDDAGELAIASNSTGTTSTVDVTGSAATILGFSATAQGSSGTTGYTISASNDTLTVAVDGGAANSVHLTQGTGISATTLAGDLQTQLRALHGAYSNVTVSATADNTIKISSGTTGTASTIAVSMSTNDAATDLGLAEGSVYKGTAQDVGFGTAGVSFTGNTADNPRDSVANSGGATSTRGIDFTALSFGSDSQAITVSATNASGQLQSTTITLANNDTSRTGRSLDETIQAINTALQQTNNPTLQSVVAVKDHSTTAEKIDFISSLAAFQVSVGSTGSGSGVQSQGSTVTATALDGGSNVDISTQLGGTAAISALTDAVSALGSAQANVGKAQNTLNYAIGLAESQWANLSAAESRIRDADMAAEAANLTKASVLQQSAIAAMVQANSAPQAVLTLLRG